MHNQFEFFQLFAVQLFSFVAASTSSRLEDIMAAPRRGVEVRGGSGGSGWSDGRWRTSIVGDRQAWRVEEGGAPGQARAPGVACPARVVTSVERGSCVIMTVCLDLPVSKTSVVMCSAPSPSFSIEKAPARSTMI